MKILITGINGFIGKKLANRLLEKGHYVIGLSRGKICNVGNINKYYPGSVLDKDIVEKAVSGAEVVVHLAALTEHKDIVENKHEASEINLTGTKNMLNAFSKSETAKKFIYSSTGKVYGDIKSLPITEEHEAKPLNILGKSKRGTEQVIESQSNDKESYIILRIFNVYGPGQKDNFVVPTILNQLDQADTITLGDIKAKRDYTHIDDVIDAFILAIEKGIENGLTILNICSGKSASAEDIVSMVSEIKGKKIDIKVDQSRYRKDEMNEEYGSYEKARKVLGWKPKISLKEGLKKTIEVQR